MTVASLILSYLENHSTVMDRRYKAFIPRSTTAVCFSASI